MNSYLLSLPPLKSIDLNKPIDKRIYKGTQPTCHDFNQFTAATETISLLVGFSAGQVQYLDLIKKDTSKLFNEEVTVGPQVLFIMGLQLPGSWVGLEGRGRRGGAWR